MQHRIIIQRPLNITFCILHPETRDDGRKAARFREKRNAGEIHGTVEHVTLTEYQGPAKSRIEEILLRDLPGDDFTRRTLLVVAGIVFRSGGLLGREFFLLGKKRIFRMLKTFGRRLRFLRKETVDHAVFHFTRIGQDVALVETDDLAEVVDARLVAIDNPRFDRMLHDVAKEFAIEDLRYRWWPDLHGPGENIPVDRIADRLPHRYQPSALQPLGVIGLAHPGLGSKSPAMKKRRQGNVGMGVEASDHRGGLKSYLVPGNAFRSYVVGVHQV